MVGRGARTTDKVFKEFFTLIDFGNNIENFGLWSSVRDWDSHFTNSKKKSNGVAPIRECPKCGLINHASARECGECNYQFPKKDKSFFEDNEAAKVVRIKDFEAPEVSVHQLFKFCQIKAWSPHKTIHLLIDSNIRILTLYDVSVERFERDWEQIVKGIWKKFVPQYKTLAGLTEGVVKQSHHNFKYWKKELLNKICEHYNVNSLILKNYGEYKIKK